MTTASLFLLNTHTTGKQTPDEELVRRVLAGDGREFAVLMRRHNQRLYRVSRSVVVHDAEAEAAVQDAYMRAYSRLGQFRGDATFAIWLTKLAIHEALTRRGPEASVQFQVVSRNPLKQPKELHSARTLEEAIDALPPNFRTVFVLRQIEMLSADETAACLLLSRHAVEARLLHARRILEGKLRPELLDQPAATVFPFEAQRSADLVERVTARISQSDDRKYSRAAAPR